LAVCTEARALLVGPQSGPMSRCHSLLLLPPLLPESSLGVLERPMGLVLAAGAAMFSCRVGARQTYGRGQQLRCKSLDKQTAVLQMGARNSERRNHDASAIGVGAGLGWYRFPVQGTGRINLGLSMEATTLARECVSR
jgi:hypothetical protein